VTSQTPPTEVPGVGIAARQQWMRTLAMAGPDALNAAGQGWEPKPAVQAVTRAAA
jgi:alpha-D-ribose 1-methylphosphonate 5-triphosphate synthase subunit PhnG